MPESAPFFVVGASRSGTTMLRLMLNAHPRLAVPPELKYFSRASAGLWLDGWRAPELSAADYEAHVRGYLERRADVFEPMGLEALARRILAAPDRDLRTPYRAVAEAWARHHGKARWGEKTPANLYWVDVLVDMFPAARFVYLVRDPRAVVASMNRIPYYGPDTALNALNWHRATTNGYDRLTGAVAEDRRTVLRYEALVEAPEREVRRLCSFLGEPYEPAMLDFHRDSERYMPAEIQTPTVTQPVTAARLEAWRATLSPSDVSTVERLCAEGMARFGYAPAAAPVPPASWLGLLGKRTYWQVQQWRHRETRGYEVHDLAFGRTRRRLGLATPPDRPPA